MTTTATTTTTMPDQTARVLALLVAGHTMQAVATRSGWPIGAVRKTISQQPGWMIDKNGRVYHPGRPKYRAQLPDGVPAELLDWARGLLAEAEAPRTIQFQEPAPPTTPPTPKTAAPRPAPAAPAKAPPVTGRSAIDGTLVTDLPLNRIHDHPGNIRDDLGDLTELAASIAAQGLLQPVTVRPLPGKPDEYELLAGHRRRAAAARAGLTSLPAVIRHDVDDAAAVEVMLVENIQRRDLNPMEKAEALGRLRDQGYSGALISARTGIPQGSVSASLALLELDDASKERVRSGELSATDAINAVRRLRKKAREARAAGSAVQAWSWEPDYLTKTHPLAKKAARLCQAREHTTRRRIGQTACGQCWESVIRADERVVIAAEADE
ncbi:ParB/RepB/Spo0J family partition protein [Actinomadura sp. ATCC 31491]|uniref:ParB/RepB/Spo0J family partition protein n=1 Tax=Actinomadura luzonensis TaxID=2805427 RepID=A0ABT0G558_9ACTN|nr:ParB/RepB/Spo0J family partition protein [Actinomadura luzonensis]MCK2219744.1 ParB/RepB/Spo0J family partition protein [Actinomadura luzonensis]